MMRLLISGNCKHFSKTFSPYLTAADDGLTGTKESREGFQKLLAKCRAGEIDVVITKSISRFARNTVTLLSTVRELKSLGIDVFFEEQNIRSASSEGELMLTILASFAQEEIREHLPLRPLANPCLVRAGGEPFRKRESKMAHQTEFRAGQAVEREAVRLPPCERDVHPAAG